MKRRSFLAFVASIPLIGPPAASHIAGRKIWSQKQVDNYVTITLEQFCQDLLRDKRYRRDLYYHISTKYECNRIHGIKYWIDK